MTAPTTTAADLRERLRRRERELRAVYDITSALHRRTSLDELQRLTLETARNTVDAAAGSILLFDANKRALVFKYVINPDPVATERLMTIELQPGQGIAGQVFQVGKGRITGDVSRDDHHERGVDEATQFTTRNLVTVPLKTTEGESIGVMQICNRRTGDFDQEDLEVLEVMAIHAASAIETARLREEAAKAVIMNLIGDISHDVKNMVTPSVTGSQTLEMMMQSMFEDMDAGLGKSTTAQEAQEAVREATSAVREFYPEVMEMTYEAAQQVQERVREIADAIKGIVSEPHFELVSINEVADAVAKALRILAEKKEIAIDLSGLGTTPRIEMDRKRMYNALYNLINNAIPETPDGGRISCHSRVVDTEAGERLEVTVRDTGRGMPAHVRERLFTDDAVSTKVGGTGLGTRVVKNVVDAHHGTISVHSEPGKGTEFVIHLPFVQPRARADAAAA